jgi:hypothetical protein
MKCVSSLFPANKGHTRYTRGCSDGKNFDDTFLDGQRFVLNTTDSRLSPWLPREGSTPPANRTVCLAGGSDLIQVCVTLCQGDFCNGPLCPEVPHRTGPPPSYGSIGDTPMLPSVSGGAILQVTPISVNFLMAWAVFFIQYLGDLRMNC